MTTPMKIADFVPAITDLLVAQVSADLRIYTRDKLPKDPLPPYVSTCYYPTGYGWSDGPFERGLGGHGTIALEVKGVGLADRDSLWSLDVVRAAFAEIDVPAVVGGVHLASLRSQGPPSEPIRAGTLYTATELYICETESTT